MLISVVIILSYLSCVSGSIPEPNILYYKFDNNTVMGESIILCKDSINNHDGVISNMGGYTIGIKNSALDLTYTPPVYVTISDHDDFYFGGIWGDSSYTISMSIKMVDYSVDCTILEKENEYILKVENSGLNFTQFDELWGGDYNKLVELDLTQFNGEYIFITLTGGYPTGISQIYVNNLGDISKFRTESITYEAMRNTDSNLIIGDTTDNKNLCIDEFQLYNRKLSDRDIEELYFSFYEGNPHKLYSIWDLIGNISDNTHKLIDLIIMFIMVGFVLSIGIFINKTVK